MPICVTYKSLICKNALTAKFVEVAQLPPKVCVGHWPPVPLVQVALGSYECMEGKGSNKAS